MSQLDVQLAKVQARVSYPEDHISILFGNAWEVSFVCNSRVIATGVAQTLDEAIRLCIEQSDKVPTHEPSRP